MTYEVRGTLNVRVFHFEPGISFYARAKVVSVADTIGLDFYAQQEPIDIGDKKWTHFEQNSDPPKKLHSENIHIGFPNRTCPVVEKVHVNLYLPENATKDWVYLCLPIGHLCRRLFVNFRANDSTL